MSIKKTITAFIVGIALAFPLSAHAFLAGAGSALCLAGGAAALPIGAGVGAVSAALSVPTIDVANLSVNTVTATQQTAEVTKECVLDGLTILIREAMIASLTDSIISWINGGFEGSPAFVGDIEGFLGSVADNVSLDFIQGTSLDFVCSPFQADIRGLLALDAIEAGGTGPSQRARFSRQISCSLSDAGRNIDAFLEDPVAGGGWDTWYEVFTKPQNTPLGAYSLARFELNERISRAVEEETKQLDFGGGFFAKGRCVYPAGSIRVTELPPPGEPQPPLPATNTRSGCEANGGFWEVVTPGAQINEQLARTLGLSAERLALADELQEIIGALMAQLAQRALTSAEGLLGLSGGSSSSSRDGRSYLESLVNETQATSFQAVRTLAQEQIQSALTFNETYLRALNETRAVFIESKNTLTILAECSDSSGNPGRAATARATISGIIDPRIEAYTLEEESARETAVLLNFLLQDALRATESASLNEVSNIYENLESQGAIKTQRDIDALTLAKAREETNLTEYAQEVGACASGTSSIEEAP